MATLTEPVPDVLSPAHWKVLLVVADTIVAELTEEETQKILVDSRSIAVTKNIRACKDFAKLKFSDDSKLTTALRDALSLMAPDKLAETASALGLLDTYLGSLLLTQKFTKFSDLSRQDREKVLTNWYGSRIAMIRSLPRGLIMVISVTFCRYYDLGFLEYDTGDYTRSKEIKNKYPDYEFLSVSPDAKEIYTDVLIIGSGSGGGVAAATLAKAGRRVLVVEKGSSHSQESFPLIEAEAAKHMYENKGIVATEDSGMTVLAGATFGGGSTINWSASLQTPAQVRQEWTKKTGIQWFVTPEFQNSQDFVCDRMGVSAEHIKHNFANAKLLEGSKKLGQHCYSVPQNTGGHEHYCGHCPHGCRNGDKLGGLATWLADAREAGAQFLKDTRVHKLVIEHDLVVGAETTYNNRPLFIRANKVIVSAGTLNTPCLLKQSGLNNPQIGKGLYLHPCSFVTAHYENEQTRTHEGGILTTVSTAVANRDGKGHGAYLEVISNQPGLHSAIIPWRSAADWKRTMLKYPHAASYIALTKDRDTGRVFPDPATGLPKVEYIPSKFDRESMLQGVLGLCDVALAAGADEITTAQYNVEPFRPNKASKLGVHDPAYKAWTAKVRASGMVPGQVGMGSAHQMGTCSIGRVCDENAKVYGYKNLWLADASVFPTCSGVNPMITTMALAHRTSLKIIEQEDIARSKLSTQFSAKL